MKKWYFILYVPLAILVLFSSSSFTISMHVCGGRVQNIALLSKAKGCAMEKQKTPCHRHQSAPCCEDETIVHNSEEFQSNITQISVNASITQEIDQPAALLIEVIPSITFVKPPYYNYDPPLRFCNRIVEHRVFLI
jgi:hypothetical protein